MERLEIQIRLTGIQVALLVNYKVLELALKFISISLHKLKALQTLFYSTDSNMQRCNKSKLYTFFKYFKTNRP